MKPLSIAIPTYRRPTDLVRCIQTIAPQLMQGDEVLVLDDSDLAGDVQKKLKDLVRDAGAVFHYIHKPSQDIPRGSSYSRNYAAEKASHEYLCIFDDDIILEKNFLDRVRMLWREHDSEKDLVALGGIITNNRKQGGLERCYNRIFGLSSTRNWDVNRNGFQVWNDHIKNQTKGYYLHGGLASYRVAYLRHIGGFIQNVSGRAALEDVVFSLRAQHHGNYFLIDPAMCAHHDHSPHGRETTFQTGIKETRNRLILKDDLKRYQQYAPLSFYWALGGWILRQFLVGSVRKGLGMIVGLWKKI